MASNGKTQWICTKCPVNGVDGDCPDGPAFRVIGATESDARQAVSSHVVNKHGVDVAASLALGDDAEVKQVPIVCPTPPRRLSAHDIKTKVSMMVKPTAAPSEAAGARSCPKKPPPSTSSSSLGGLGALARMHTRELPDAYDASGPAQKKISIRYGQVKVAFDAVARANTHCNAAAGALEHAHKAFREEASRRADVQADLRMALTMKERDPEPHDQKIDEGDI